MESVSVRVCIASAKRLATSGITVRSRPASSKAADPAYLSLVQGTDQGQIGGVLELTGYSVRLLRLIAMVTVSWPTSILAFSMFWFSKWHESD